MFIGMIRRRAPSTPWSRFPLSRWLKPMLQTAILALACVAVAGPAFAATAYDGNWSVVIATTGGACDPAFRYSIAISNGLVVNPVGNAATVEGRVTPKGAVSVSVQSGNQQANGSGHLGMNRGSGVWRGQGSAGACQGTWGSLSGADQAATPSDRARQSMTTNHKGSTTHSTVQAAQLPLAKPAFAHMIRRAEHTWALTASGIPARERFRDCASRGGHDPARFAGAVSDGSATPTGCRAPIASTVTGLTSRSLTWFVPSWTTRPTVILGTSRSISRPQAAAVTGIVGR